MLSRGHPCLRRRLSTALDSVAAGPDEPLLFLYPRWAASNLRRQPITSLAPAQCPPKNRRTPASLVDAKLGPSPPLCRQPTRWISHTPVRAKSTADGDQSRVPAGSGPKSHSEHKGVKGDPDSSSGAGKSPAAKIPTVNFFADLEKRSSAESLHRARSSRFLGRRAAARKTRVVKSKRAKRVRNSSEKLRQSVAFRKSLKGTVKSEFARINRMWRLSSRDRKKLRSGMFLKLRSSPKSFRSGKELTWKDMRDLLEQVQNDPRASSRRGANHVEIDIPEETVNLLCGINEMSFQENIWFIHVRNGCRVHLLHPYEGGMQRRAILSGSEYIIEQVVERIRRAQKLQQDGDPLVDVRKPPLPFVVSREALEVNKIPVPQVRCTWSPPPGLELNIKLDVFLASKPSLLTVKDFTEYVEDLIFTVPSNSDLRNKNPIPHAHQVARELLALFRSPSHQKLFSTAAVNMALEFLYKHNQVNAARYVFMRAEHVATTQTYNIHLTWAAQHHDIREFRRYLLMMPRARVLPNARTWLALLNAMVTPNSKASLISRMVKQGYMERYVTIRQTLQLTIQDSLLVHLESGQSMGSFIDLMVKTRGANSFNGSLLGQMFSVTSRLKDFKAAEDLMHICERFSLPVEDSALMQVLPMCRGDIFTAIHYTLRFMKMPSFKITGPILQKLFLMAFKGRHYNICRVLWRYACLKGDTGYDMAQSILRSLMRNPGWVKHPHHGAKYGHLDNIFLEHSGKIIAGIDFHLPDYYFNTSLLEDLPPEFRAHPLLFLTIKARTNKERRLQVRLAHDIIGRDRWLGSTYFTPEHSLSIMLDAAVNMDIEWKDKPRPLSWMMQNAIMVPVLRPYTAAKRQRRLADGIE